MTPAFRAGRGATRGVLVGFLLGSLCSAGAALAAKSVEVTFYKSETPSVWCYLADSIAWVECIDDPCAGYREEAERLRRQLRSR